MKFKFLNKPPKKKVRFDLEPDRRDLDTALYSNASRSVAVDTTF